MKYRKYNSWKIIHSVYSNSNASLKNLAQYFQVNYSALRVHKIRCGWKRNAHSEINKLSYKHKIAFKDYIHGMTYKDLAKKYNVSINTVKSWKCRYWKRNPIWKSYRPSSSHIYNNIQCYNHFDFGYYKLLIENIIFKSHLNKSSKHNCIYALDMKFMSRNGHTGYNQCSSKGEYLVKEWLDTHHIKYIQQFTFKRCKNKKELPFDFYLPGLNICIEYDGKQHFMPVKYFGGNRSFANEKLRDNIKNHFCHEYNIHLVRIPFYANIRQFLNLNLLHK